MNEEKFSHVSVLLWECIDALNIRDGLTYVDCTTGGAGHSLEIAKRMGEHSRLICFDRDEQALAAAKIKLSSFLNQVTFIHDNFSSLGKVLKELSIDNLGGVLMDLGCSSHQFDTADRGFSYQQDALLDMRMDQSANLTAEIVVNTYAYEELRRIIFEYGEERFAPRIAQRIITEREKAPILSTCALSDIIRSAIPAANREKGPHPARRTFQAIRIEVNAELDAISPAIHSATNALLPTGRIAAISFHSLEDRLVKSTYKDLSSGCTCPKDFPVCICGNKPSLKIITKKPQLPSAGELEANPRSRSSKLRIAEKLPV